MNYMIYTKAVGQDKYKATDITRGTQVSNLIYATLIPEHKLEAAKVFAAEICENEKGLFVQIRQAGKNGKAVFEARHMPILEVQLTENRTI